jgi:hypothetical protein
LSDKDNIILFPTGRIKDKHTVNHPVNEKEHKRLVEEQTKEFVEGNVDDIAYQLLDKFVAMGIRTNQLTFTADLALVIDAIRGLVYRDFNRKHPAQTLSDKMVTLNTSGKNKSARLDYSKILDVKHKPHKPLSRDIEDEVRDLSDMADIHFTPDFEPDNDK